MPGYPSDYCATAGNPQALELTNNGNVPANNVWVHLDHFGGNNMGLDPSSITVKIGNMTVPVTPSFSSQVQFWLSILVELAWLSC